MKIDNANALVCGYNDNSPGFSDTWQGTISHITHMNLDLGDLEEVFRFMISQIIFRKSLWRSD